MNALCEMRTHPQLSAVVKCDQQARSLVRTARAPSPVSANLVTWCPAVVFSNLENSFNLTKLPFTWQLNPTAKNGEASHTSEFRVQKGASGGPCGELKPAFLLAVESDGAKPSDDILGVHARRVAGPRCPSPFLGIQSCVG